MTRSLLLALVWLVLFLVAGIEVNAQSSTTFKTLLRFNGAEGNSPIGSLVQGFDGDFYGTTRNTIFKITTEGDLTTLYTLCHPTNCVVTGAALTLALDGNFYGTTINGGAKGCGSVFKITPQGELTTLYSFNCIRGNDPGPSGLIQVTDGNFYGTTYSGGDVACYSQGCGTVFRITPAGAFETLYKFSSVDAGYGPSGLLQATDGNFYGMTSGGSNGYGTIFAMTPKGKVTTIYSFDSTTNGPTAVVQGTDGDFYGLTSGDGATTYGSFFRMTTGGTLTVVYTFPSYTVGSFPYSLIQASDGDFYGATAWGGAYCEQWCGTIFNVTSGSPSDTLHSFCFQVNSEGACTGGNFPNSLMQATNGTFYGTTALGGEQRTGCSGGPPPQNGCGTIFSMSTGIGPFVTFVRKSGKVGTRVEILGQDLRGTTDVSFNGVSTCFTVESNTYLTATVPDLATTGFVKVTTHRETLQSNKIFVVAP